MISQEMLPYDPREGVSKSGPEHPSMHCALSENGTHFHRHATSLTSPTSACFPATGVAPWGYSSLKLSTGASM